MLSFSTTTISTSVGARISRLFFMVSLVMGGGLLGEAGSAPVVEAQPVYSHSKDAEFMTELRNLRNIQGITLQEGSHREKDGSWVDRCQLEVRERHGLFAPIVMGIATAMMGWGLIASIAQGEVGMGVLCGLGVGACALTTASLYSLYKNPPTLCVLDNDNFFHRGVSTPWSQVGDCTTWEREIDHGSTIYHQPNSSWGTSIPHKSYVTMLSVDGKYGASLMKVSSDIMPVGAKRLKAVINTFKSLAAAK